MSEKLNSSCPVCGGYLFDDDDIVYCPVCGAPHHRDCYTALGHCGCEAHHGEVKNDSNRCEQKDEKPFSKNCEYCEKPIPEDTNFCPYCGKIQPPETADNDGKDFPNVKFVSFSLGGVNIPRPDPCGGLDKESSIDGVKVKDIARFVSFGPDKLLPKFKQFQEGSRRFSWNWMAFISPYSYTIFRKMGFLTLMYALIELTAFVLMSPLYYSLAYMDMPINSTAMQVVETFSADPLKYTSVDSIILAVLGFLLFIGYRVFSGLFTEKLYKKHVIGSIKKIRSDLDCDEEYAFYRNGGVRPIISLIVFLLMFQFGNYIPLLIAGFIFG